MHCFEGDSIDRIYVDAVNAVRRARDSIRKDGREIKEVYSVVFRFLRPQEGILCVEGRPYSPAFAVAEMLWNLTADVDDWLCKYNRKYAKYFTAGQLLSGYGARLMNWSGGVNQIERAVSLLKRCPDSQHANLVIFDPSVDLSGPKFVPCITMIKLRLRHGRLYCSSFLRAQDIWLGFPYDVFLLLNIFQLIAIELGVEMGEYHHYCDVLRLYEENFNDADQGLSCVSSVANRRIDLESGGKDIRGRLTFYRDLVRDQPEDMLAIALSQPPYWRDCLLACHAYSHLRQGHLGKAAESVGMIGNAFRDQFEIWAIRYWPKFRALLGPISRGKTSHELG